MKPVHRAHLLAVIASMPWFSACGGGGGDSGGAGPNPSPTPAPAAVTIFANPTPQVYASLGSSTTNAGDGYTPIAATARLTDVSLESANQPLVRYTAAGRYDLQLPGAGFVELVHYSGLQNPTTENNFFQPSSAGQNAATFIVSRSRLSGYRHTELASWTNSAPSVRAGNVAFGTPTPSAAIATSGSATYRGRVFGLVDITGFDNLYGGWYFLTVEGTVTLAVDFARREVTGTMAITVDGDTVAYPVPLLAATILPADTYSGSFETPQSGFNELKVRLTGPDASELIGSWSVPLAVGGVPHQLIGVWIARRD